MGLEVRIADLLFPRQMRPGKLPHDLAGFAVQTDNYVLGQRKNFAGFLRDTYAAVRVIRIVFRNLRGPFFPAGSRVNTAYLGL